ncbi:MAG: hypothetical protein IJO29_01385 [Oscillospiraceae bacterium]|nr:hypothetical protein [Oscillospiraceae bacterium]
MQNELRIPFESLLNRGIQRRMIDAMNDDGFLNKTYTQAFRLVETICATSKRITHQDEIHNVIAFMGRRGTGKTSAMLSVADSLSDVKHTDEVKISNCFIQLPYINAAILDETEDIFLIILSSMFKKIDEKSKREDFPYKKERYDNARMIKEDICNIYGHYVSLKCNDNLTSSYNSMEKLSDRYSIREEFTNLVLKYTNFHKELFEPNSSTNDMHLIICIDDIDMSRQNHMRIMQCIHQYLMIPHMIVMVTLNLPVLTASLQKETFLRLSTTEEKNKQNLHLAFEHTHDFLRKIIPSDMRITMPSWRKYDYRALTPVRINLGTSAKLDEYRKNFPALKHSILFKKLEENGMDADYAVSPKELVLIILADRTQVYLDAKGNKFHFMEPDSLRNLYDIFYMIYQMKDIASLKRSESTDITLLLSRKANVKILLDYLYFKLFPEYDFSQREEKLIREFLAEPIDRRGKRIWEYYYNCLTSEDEQKRIVSIYGENFFNEEKNRYVIDNYSFGELFRILYSASRIGLMDQKLIRFILASFSFSLPQCVEDEKWKNSSSTEDYFLKKDNYRNLRDIFGYTLLGTWCKDLFEGSLDTLIYPEAFCDFCDEDANGTLILNTENIKFRFFVYDLLLLLLMSSRSTREPYIVNQNYITTEYHIENHIDPTSFIINSLCAEERLTNMKFINELSYIYRSKCDDAGNTVYSISELLTAILRHSNIDANVDDINSVVTGLMKELQTSLQQSNILWFFLKHTDLAYNVIKRAVYYILYSSEMNLRDTKANQRTPLETIQKLYEIIYKKLKENDDVYHLTEDSCRFSEMFRNHIIVQKYCGDLKENIDSSRYKEYDEIFSNGCGIKNPQKTINKLLIRQSK